MHTMPFSDDVMTIIMGIEPEEPGMHGPCEVPCPTEDATDLIIKIRDMCDKWLLKAGKNCVKESMDADVSEEEDDDGAPEDGEEE